MDRNTKATRALVILLAVVFALFGVATSCKSPTGPSAPGDTTAPTVTIVSTTTDPTGNPTIDVTITFSEAVTGFEDTDLTVVNATASPLATTDSTTFTTDLTPSPEMTVTLDIGAGVCTDAAGNPNTAAAQFSRFYTERPVPIISSGTPDPTNQASIPITITFNKPVKNGVGSSSFEAADITPDNCTISGFTETVTNTQWTANLIPVVDGLARATVPAGACEELTSTVTNVASNTFSITYDTTPPDISTMTSSAPDPTNTPYTIDITFSEAIDPATFTGTDITFTAGTGSASDPTTSNNINWTSTITPTSQGTVTVTINAAAVKDLAGNDNTAATGSVSRKWDTVQPGVTSITSTTSAITGAYPIPCTVDFTEAINPTSFTESDITVSGAQVQASSLTTTDNQQWKFNLIYTVPGGAISATISAGKVSDPAGNTNTALVTALSRTAITALPFNGAVSARGATSPLSTPSINAGNKNPIALIGVTVENTSAIDITKVEYGTGNEATLIGSKIKWDNGTNYWIVTALYYILPPTGNKSVTVTFTAPPAEAKVGCVVLERADQVSPILGVQTQDIAGPTGTNYVLSTGITSTSYWSTLVDMFGGSDATAATVATGQMSGWTQLDTGACGGSSYKPLTAPPGEAATVGWTLSLSQALRLQHEVVEIKIQQ